MMPSGYYVQVPGGITYGPFGSEEEAREVQSEVGGKVVTIGAPVASR